jgi:hypothetical protein
MNKGIILYKDISVKLKAAVLDALMREGSLATETSIYPY